MSPRRPLVTPFVLDAPYVPSPSRFRRGTLLTLVIALLSGCASSSDDRDVMAGLKRTERAIDAEAQALDKEAPLLVNGAPIELAAIAGPLREAAGDLVVQEVVLERLLETELGRRGMVLREDAIEAERALLREALEREVLIEEDERDGLIDAVRRARGLGEIRFRSLLLRNAMLRALVRDEAAESVVPEDLQIAFEMRYGVRYRIRLILSPDFDGVVRAHRLLIGANIGDVSFGELASQVSSDVSAQRGGLLEPISPVDPSYELALRTSLDTVPVGEISPVMSLRDGYAFFRVESVLPASPTTFDDVRDALSREILFVRERAYMDRLARSMLRDAAITVFDPSLRWSWERTQIP